MQDHEQDVKMPQPGDWAVYKAVGAPGATKNLDTWFATREEAEKYVAEFKAHGIYGIMMWCEQVP